MEFEQWFKQYAPTAPELLDDCAKAAWDAATKAEREACAKVAEAAAVEAERVGKTHPEDSDSRDRMFARSREAGYISDEILARSNAELRGAPPIGGASRSNDVLGREE